MTPRFELHRGYLPLRRRWYFQLIAGNGEPLCTSEPYNTKQAALDGITALRSAASTAVTHDLTR